MGWPNVDGNVEDGYPETKKWKAKFREAEDADRKIITVISEMRSDRTIHRSIPTAIIQFGALGHGGGYGHVYYKTAVGHAETISSMCWAMSYSLEAMQHYVQQLEDRSLPEERTASSSTVLTRTGSSDQWMGPTRT